MPSSHLPSPTGTPATISTTTSFQEFIGAVEASDLIAATMTTTAPRLPEAKMAEIEEKIAQSLAGSDHASYAAMQRMTEMEQHINTIRGNWVAAEGRLLRVERRAEDLEKRLAAVTETYTAFKTEMEKDFQFVSQDVESLRGVVKAEIQEYLARSTQRVKSSLDRFEGKPVSDSEEEAKAESMHTGEEAKDDLSFSAPGSPGHIMISRPTSPEFLGETLTDMSGFQITSRSPPRPKHQLPAEKAKEVVAPSNPVNTGRIRPSRIANDIDEYSFDL